MKVALITGIKRIGFEIGKFLLEKGYNLGVVYRTSKGNAEKLKELAEDKGLSVLEIKADLKESSSYTYVVNEVINSFGRIDVFIHLASPYYKTPVEEVSSENFYDHFKPITEAFFFISKEAFKYMMKNEGDVKGRILAFGDWAVENTPYRNYSAYLISKGALHTAVKVLAKEFAPYVPVNCVALGPTLKAESYTDKEWEKILKNTPLQRPVSMKDVLKITGFLIETDSVTGEIIMLDGGRHIAGTGR